MHDLWHVPGIITRPEAGVERLVTRDHPLRPRPADDSDARVAADDGMTSTMLPQPMIPTPVPSGCVREIIPLAAGRVRRPRQASRTREIVTSH